MDDVSTEIQRILFSFSTNRVLSAVDEQNSFFFRQLKQLSNLAGGNVSENFTSKYLSSDFKNLLRRNKKGMNRRKRPDIMKQTKEANIRERRRLTRRIEGFGGINAQYRFDSQQTDNQCSLIRRELAQSILDETNRKRRELMKRNERKMSRDTDPTLLLMKEREERRRKKNYRLLVRAHEKQKKTEERVKEFVARLEKEELQNKENVDQKMADILLLVNNLEANADLEIRTGSRLISTPDSRPVSRAWKEARKTRYIRTRKLRDFEVELTAKEIFSRETTPKSKSRIQTASKIDRKKFLGVP